MRVPSLLLAAAFVPAALPALDLFDFADLRVGATMVGTSVKVTSDSGTTKDTSKEAWDQATRFNADLLFGTDLVLVGIAYGVGATFDQRSGDAVSSDTTIGRVQAGPYIDFTIFQLELLPFVGVGTSRIQDEVNDADGKAKYARCYVHRPGEGRALLFAASIESEGIEQGKAEEDAANDGVVEIVDEDVVERDGEKAQSHDCLDDLGRRERAFRFSLGHAFIAPQFSFSATLRCRLP